ncbi:hypothetical protein VTN96DRAFT_2964 [Rasamsonia emersonii]
MDSPTFRNSHHHYRSLPSLLHSRRYSSPRLTQPFFSSSSSSFRGFPPVFVRGRPGKGMALVKVALLGTGAYFVVKKIALSSRDDGNNHH